jgi:hypothetical protein
MMEISFDEVNRIVLLGEAAVESYHETFDCDEEVFCALIWRVLGDFGVKGSSGLMEEVRVVADLFGGSLGPYFLIFDDEC